MPSFDQSYDRQGLVLVVIDDLRVHVVSPHMHRELASFDEEHESLLLLFLFGLIILYIVVLRVLPNFILLSEVFKVRAREDTLKFDD